MSERPWSKAIELIDAYRRRTGASDLAIAQAVGISTTTMSRICAGIRGPDFVTAKAFRERLGIPFEAWFKSASKSFQRRYRIAA